MTNLSQPCRHCGRPRCHRHCYDAPDGEHRVDPRFATAADDNREGQVLVDVVCALCSQRGSVRIEPNTIAWE